MKRPEVLQSVCNAWNYDDKFEITRYIEHLEALIERSTRIERTNNTEESKNETNRTN